jgi:hypothetical protein
MDIEHTKHNFPFFHCCFLGQVVHPSSVRCRLLVITLPLGSLLVGLLRAIVRQVTFFPTSKTLVGGIGNTSLHGSIIGRTLTLRLIPTLLWEGVGCHSAAGMGDVAGTDCEKGPDHDSTDQKEASVDYPTGN